MVARAWDSRLAHRIALSLRHTPVHPTHVTVVGALIGLAGAALYALGSTRAAALGAALYVVSSVLDHVDGELARLTGRSSPRGRTYDRVADLVVRFALFTGMGLGLRHGALGRAAVALGLAAGVAVVAIFVVRGAIAARRGWDAIAQPAVRGVELEDVLYVIAPVTWLGVLAPFLVAVGVGAPLFALWSAWVLHLTRETVPPAPHLERALRRRP